MRCPFESQNGKCTYKPTSPLKSKKKRYCGYSKLKDCVLLQDWLESLKSSKDGLKSLRALFGDEGEDDIKK